MSLLPHHQLHILQLLCEFCVFCNPFPWEVTGSRDINQTFPTLRNNFRLKTPTFRVYLLAGFYLWHPPKHKLKHRQTFDKCIDNMTSVRKFTIAFNLIHSGNCCCCCCCLFGALYCILICGL